jgi:hypothetical protein
MSFDGCVRDTNASFLYSGCYRARAGMSFAQRAAWGLRDFAPPSAGQTTAVERPQQAASEWCASMAHATLTSSNPMQKTSVPHDRGRQTPRKRRHAVCSPVFVRLLQERLRCIGPQPLRLEGAGRYRRFSACVNGQYVTCVVLRGRVYIRAGSLREHRVR